MVSQENKANKVNQEVKDAQAERDHAEPPDNPEDSSQSQDHKAQLDHQDKPENPVQRVNQAQTDNRSKDPQDCPEMPVPQAEREDQDQLEPQDQLAPLARRDRANTVLLLVPHQVIKYLQGSLDPSGNWLYLLLFPFLTVYSPLKNVHFI